jgi:CrcB protein
MSALAVFVFGGLGALARYGTQFLVRVEPGRFPWATFATNVVGCVLAGALCTALAFREETSPLLRNALMIGFIGGFTTYSAFAWETWELWQSGRLSLGVLYVLATFAGCGAGVALGAFAART